MADMGTLLKKVIIFNSLNKKEMTSLQKYMKSEDIPGHTIIFNEGDPGDIMYIVISGAVAISVKLPDGKDLEIAEIEQGNFFGEMSIFDNAPRSATCYTKEDSRLLALKGEDFSSFLEDNPKAAIKVMYKMVGITTERLQNTGSFLSDMVTWGEKARKRALTDEFTGLYNRRYLDDTLKQKFADAKINNKPLSLVMVDLDHFGQLNKEYGEAVGDQVILEAVSAFKKVFRDEDILARYGGDEFTFILTNTDPDKAFHLCSRAVEEVKKIPVLKDKKGSMKETTSSMGIASYPMHASDLESLKENTDKALYEAKEQGRDRARMFTPQVKLGRKHPFSSIRARNRVIDNLIKQMEEGCDFLLLGHKHPDDDCISSMTALALLLVQFGKNVSLFIRKEVPGNLEFQMSICKYNGINILNGEDDAFGVPDTVVYLDTPKPDMRDLPKGFEAYLSQTRVRQVEIDHHMDADSGYSGEPELSLVDEASSSCDLVGLLSFKINRRKDLLEKYGIDNVFPRNFVLTVLTGIVGDSHMGKFLKSKREEWYYRGFSSYFSRILAEDTFGGSEKISTLEEIYQGLIHLSAEEEECFHFFLSRRNPEYPRIEAVMINEKDMALLTPKYSQETIIAAVKYTADFLCEKSGYVSIFAFFENPEISDLVQFRMRRSYHFKDMDFRDFLKEFAIKDGGGHPGAIGFRFSRKERDAAVFMEKLLKSCSRKIEKALTSD